VAVIAVLVLGATGLLRRLRIWGKAVFIFSAILLSLHYLYWVAVFAYNGYWVQPIVMAVAIPGFFFFQKITKIKREKRNPQHEEVHS